MKSDVLTAKEPVQQAVLTTPIAIIGMASIFPGARTLSGYWENILQKIDSIIDVPVSRWDIDDYYDPDPDKEDKTYCRRGAFIPDVVFDPAVFGLPPNLLEVTDVSQLLSLVVAKECLEDGGYDKLSPEVCERTGVILGIVGINNKLAVQMMSRLQYPIWEKVLRNHGLPAEETQQIIGKIKSAYPSWNENSFPGFLGNVVAGRIANRFNLGGINCIVDAACGSSLSAIRMAVSELIEGRADMMISGGVDTDNSPGTYMSFSKTPAFSTGDHARPFDQDSNGMMVGEGIGMILLKRLADAEKDGDRVYAVIKGIGASSDGRFKSIYAPNPNGQSKALYRAYHESGYSPNTVGLIEAHGTGTKAGDPAEFQGLVGVFSDGNSRKQHIALGSVKSQIGHTKAAAGVAGLIKVSLALFNKVLPPTINVTKPHPDLTIDQTPFYLNTEMRPWIKPSSHPRRAGVSAFGFGGTNFHIALEEYEDEHKTAYRMQRTAQVILISAATTLELLQTCRALSTSLALKSGIDEFTRLVQATRVVSLKNSDPRLGFSAFDAGDAANLLNLAADMLLNIGDKEDIEHPAGIFYRKNGLELKGKVVALFPGQGSQYLNMGRELAANFPPVRQAFTDMDRLFQADGLSSLSEIVYPIPAFDNGTVEQQTQRLKRTENAQPSIGIFSFGLYELFRQSGFRADFAAGHSFGELTALWAAGVLDNDGFLMLAKARGKAMMPSGDPTLDAGAMLAVKGDVDRLQNELLDYPEISISNHNSKNQVVLAGASAPLAHVEKALADQGYSVVRIDVSAAFHTQLVAHTQRPFAEALKQIEFHKPAIKVYSNTTGKKYGADPDQIRRTLADHILQPVLFKDEIEEIYRAGGSVFVEFGPKNVLTNLVNDILDGKPHYAIALNPNPHKDSDRLFRDAVAHLRVLGFDLRQIDPYGLPAKQKSDPNHSSVSITLNGGLYQSEKTRSAIQASLTEKNVLYHQPIHSMEIYELDKPALPREMRNMDPANMLDYLNSFQSEALKVHSQFLSNDNEYVSSYARLAQQSLDLLKQHAEPELLEQINHALQTMDRGMDQFHQLHAETIRIHEQFIGNQEALFNQVLQVLDGSPSSDPHPYKRIAPRVLASSNTQPITQEETGAASNNNGHKSIADPDSFFAAPVDHAGQASFPIDSPPGTGNNDDNLKDLLFRLISEKTGYPTEMLDLAMDLETDLGIDSIKRVEIFGAIQAQVPDFSEQDTSKLAELRTLEQILAYMKTVTDTIDHKEISNELSSTEEAKPADFVEEIKQRFLQIVSEKTGFPAEMIELGMDMESDLGIDSIKRVEILGSMQALFPELSSIDTVDLANLHTLEQIVESMISGGSNTKPSLETSSELAASDQTSSEIERRVATLKLLPAPDFQEIEIPTDHICLLTDDGTDFTLAVAEKLTREGKKVVIAQLSQDLINQRNFPGTLNSVLFTDLSEQGLREQLETIQRESGRVSIFIHLDPFISPSGFLANDELSVTKTIFLIAKLLKCDLNDSAESGFSGFFTVSRMDGMFGFSPSGTFEPASAAFFGLAKTLSLEWEKVFCRAVDLDPQIKPYMAADLMMTELHDPDRLIREIAYRSGDRYTLDADPSAVQDGDTLSQLLTPQSVILVSGGARGITAQCVTRLAQHTPAQFILIGRTDISQEEPDWAQSCPSDAELKQRIVDNMTKKGEKPTPQAVEKLFRNLRAKQEVEATLHEVRQAGAEVVYVNADITAPFELLQEQLSEPISRMGKISGVIHGAGMLTDRLIEKKTAKDFDTVFDPKVIGLSNLLKIAPPEQLDFLVMFSSIVGFSGNIGQSDYAMANEVLNKAAFQIKKRTPTCHVLSINWGPWDSGMVTPDLARRFTERKMAVIPSGVGSRLLLKEIISHHPAKNLDVQLIFGSMPHLMPRTLVDEKQHYRISRRLRLEANPFLLDHQIGQKPVLPATCAAAWFARTCEQLYPGYQFHTIEDFKVLKGIVFDETLVDEYLLDLEEVEKTSGNQIKLTGRIWSRQIDGLSRYHYSASTTLVSKMPGTLQHEVPADLFLIQPDSISGDELYQDGTLFQGPVFQGVRQVFSMSETNLAMECISPNISRANQGQFPIQSVNPFILDAFVQSLLIWTQRYYQAPCLPSQLARLEYYKPIPFNTPCMVDLRIVSSSDFSVTADIWIVDSAGDLFMKFVGLQGTISPSLKRLFGVPTLGQSADDLND